MASPVQPVSSQPPVRGSRPNGTPGNQSRAGLTQSNPSVRLKNFPVVSTTRGPPGRDCSLATDLGCSTVGQLAQPVDGAVQATSQVDIGRLVAKIQKATMEGVDRKLCEAGVIATPEPLAEDTIYLESEDEDNGETVVGPDGTTRRRAKGSRVKLGPIKLNFMGEQGPHSLITFLDAFKEAVRMRKLSPKQKAQHLRVCVTGEAYKQVIQPMDLKEKNIVTIRRRK